MTASDTADLLAMIDRLYAGAVEASDHSVFMATIAAGLGVHRAALRHVTASECCRSHETGSAGDRLSLVAEGVAFGKIAEGYRVTIGFLLHDGSPVALDLFCDPSADGADCANWAHIHHMLPHVKRAIHVRTTIQGRSPLDPDGADGSALADASQRETAFIEQHFGLPPSQARLMALLYRGHSIKSAAMHLRITEGSARQYLKRIFEKTGARRQVDLVRLAARVLT